MGTFARSWDLTKTSFRVLKQDKELLWMPVLSGISTVLTLLMVTGVAYSLGLAPEVTDASGGVKPMAFVLTFATYILLAFITLFFASAVVAGAMERLSGGDPTVKSALKAAWSKVGKIFVWAVIVGTVNMVLQVLREAANRMGGDIGRFVAHMLISLGAGMWNLATWFVVPVLLFENHGVGGSVKSSVNIVKRHWGEAVVANVGLGLAGFVFTLVALGLGLGALFLLAPLGLVGIVAGLAVLVAGVLAVATVFSALGGVYKAALYRFATTSVAPPGFTTEQLSQAYVRNSNAT